MLAEDIDGLGSVEREGGPSALCSPQGTVVSSEVVGRKYSCKTNSSSCTNLGHGSLSIQKWLLSAFSSSVVGSILSPRLYPLGTKLVIW